MFQLLVFAYLAGTLFIAVRFFTKSDYSKGCATLIVASLVPPILIIAGIAYLFHDGSKPSPQVARTTNGPTPFQPRVFVKNRANPDEDENPTMLLPGYIGAVTDGDEAHRSCFKSIEDMDALDAAVEQNDTGKMMHYIYDATSIMPGQHILGLEMAGVARMRVRLLDTNWTGTECYIERDLVTVKHMHKQRV